MGLMNSDHHKTYSRTGRKISLNDPEVEQRGYW